MTAIYAQFILSSEEEIQVARLREEEAIKRFRDSIRHHRAHYSEFVGGDGCGAGELSWNTRRRIMAALRNSTRVLGVGQKRRIGRLGAGTAIGAVLASVASPALAQYAAGGGSATGLNSVAIGSGATATHVNGVATGTNNTATGDNAVAIGSNNNVNTFDGTGAVINNGILDRAIGGNYTFPGGGTQLASHAIGIGSFNTVAVGGLAIGTSNVANGGGVTALAIGLGNVSTGGFGVTLGVANRASATSAIAIGTATTASGNTAIAMGRQSTASGQTSVALGNVATANQTNAIAIGHSTQATALGAIAIGGGNNGASTNLDATAATASSTNAVAIGTSTLASGNAATALGNNAEASGGNSVALGDGTLAIGGASTAIGQNTQATGAGALAIGGPGDFGGQTIARGNDSTAVGPGAQTATGAIGAIALGASADGNTTYAIGVGDNASATGQASIAMGRQATTNAANAIAIGTGASATGSSSLAIGTGNQVSGNNSGAIGDPNTITGSGSYALGNNNTINADNAFAIGNNITIAAGRNGSVGIGNATTVGAPNTGLYTLNGGTAAATAPAAVVSIGAAGAERQLTNVAAGVVSATSTDAINGSQLYTVAVANNNLGTSVETIIGNGTNINADGTLNVAPTFAVAGSSYNTVANAFNALNNANITANNGLAAALGGGAAVAANGTVTAPSYTIGASTYNNVGDALQAVSGGFNLTSSATGTGTIGGTTVEAIAAGETVTVQAGDNLVGTQSGNTISLALNPNLTGVTSLAITGGPTINGSGIALAAGDGFDAAGSTLSNVGAGAVNASSSDAVNGSQLFAAQQAAAASTDALGASTAANLGGTATYNPATDTISGLAISVGGTSYGNVTDAIQAAGAGFNLTTAATGTGTVSGASVEGIAAGETVTLTAGNNIQVTQSGNSIDVALNPVLTGVTSLAITGGPTINGSGIAMNGDGITGLAAGSTTAGSTDAINGSQLNTAMASVATDLGGGASYNPVTGQLTAPGYAIDGTTYNNVGDALAALAAENQYIDFNSTLAAANASGNNASAIGPNAQAAGNNASAFGVNSDASGNGSLALGANAVATGTNSVALGMNSQAGTNNGGWAGTTIAGVTMTNAQNANAVVSISGGTTNRQLTGVADGAVNASSTDAVNGAQLFSTATALDNKAGNIGAGLAAALGGGANVAANGTITAPSFNVNGSTHNTVADALAAAGAGFNFTTAASGSGTMAGTSVAGIGAGETLTITAGNNLVGTQTGNGVELGLNPVLTGITSMAITGGPSIGSAGIAMNGDGITGMANGAVNATSTDAVTGAQLFAAQNSAAGSTDALGASVAANLGGTASYDPLTDTVNGLSIAVAGGTETNVTDAIQALDTANITANTGLANALGGGAAVAPDGTVTAPTKTVQGSTYNNVGDAIGGVNTALTNLANGTSGLVQQVGGAPGNGLITVGAATGGTVVSFAGTGGNRVLTDVAPGALTAASDDAINGSQIHTLSTSMADALGGGATFDPVTGSVTAPSFNVAGGTHSSVGDAFAALNSANDSANSGIASTIGGGMAIGPNGTVTAPVFNVNGSTYNTVADALAAAGGGFNLTTAASGSGVANGTSVSQIGAGETVKVTAGNNIITTQNGNDVEIALNPDLTGIDSLAITGGVTINGAGINMNGDGITGLAAGSTAAGSTDAINGGQLNTGLASVATNLGGGSAYDPVTGTVTTPSYTVQGSTYNNVGDAFGGVNAALTNLANGTSGLVQQVGGAPGNGLITVGAATGGTTVSFAGTAGDRVLTGVAAGALSPASTDAVNGSQINALASSAATTIGGGASFDPATGTLTAPAIHVGGMVYNTVTAAIEAGDDKTDEGLSDVASALGGGATYDPLTGNISGPNYVLGGNSYTNVGSALSAIANGGLGPVQYSNAATRTTPNGGTPTNNLTLVGATAGPVTLSNVAPGALTTASTDAVNGSQLNTGLASVASGLGGGSAFNPLTGTITSPSYAIQGGSQNNVGDALTALNSAVNNITNGTSGLVQQNGGAPGSGQITVGAATGGTLLNVAGTDGNRVVSGVANGAVNATSSEAVNGSQLHALQQNVAATNAQTQTTINNAGQGTASHFGGGASYDPATGQISAPSYSVAGQTYSNVGDALTATNRAAVQYVPDANGNPTNVVQLSGANNGQPVAVRNVAAGAVTASSTDAVNGSQLYTVQQTAAGAVQYDRNSDGSLNRGSVSLGTPGTPVQLRNVAPAVVSTDAVNLGQMQASLASNLTAANAYTDGRFNELSFDLRDVAQKAYAGTASAIALQPPALFDPGTVSMRGGFGYYRGEWALGLGLRATADNGRWSLSGGVSGGPNAGVAASAGIDILIGD